MDNQRYILGGSPYYRIVNYVALLGISDISNKYTVIVRNKFDTLQ